MPPRHGPTAMGTPVQVASCVWSQYFPQDHHIGVHRPGDTRDTKYYSLVDEKEGRYKAALTFRDCFRNAQQWAPLLQHFDLTDSELTTISLNYIELIRAAANELSDFDNVLQENVEDVLACMGISLCLIRHELRVAAEETALRQRAVPLDRSKITVRLHGVAPVLPISDLRSDVINRLVSVIGTVVRVSAIKPLVTRCDFVCAHCNEVTSRAFPDGKFTPPTKCEHSPCRSKTLVPNRSTVETVDYQLVKVQEVDNSDAGPGRVPRMVEVELYEDLVDSCIPGNIVTISGIVKSVNSEVHRGRYGKRAQAHSLSILYLSANSVENAATNSRMKDSASDVDFSKADLEDIRNIIRRGNVFDRLVHSLCPGIYRNELVKAGLILSLLGGTRYQEDQRESVTFTRADSHVLVVGDPGLGKSQMLRAVASVAPRSVYVGGNTTTTTGLTVTMVRDGTGDYALEAGALVLADQGVCCIDEFDKMGVDAQSLLEGMEQQRISIAKAGIVCSLNARASVIAAANPAGGHYDRSRSIVENLKMKAALLSRFDLVFVLLDRPDEERDRLLSEHVMQSHSKRGASRKRAREDERPSQMAHDAKESLAQRLLDNAREYTSEAISLYLMRKYISYARRYIHPRLSPEASDVLKRKYLDMRSTGDSTTMPVTTRQLESLVRMAQARAKAEFSEVVTPHHAQDVVELLQESVLDAFASDEVDMNFGRKGGMSLAKRVKAYVARLMKTAQRRNNQIFTFDELLEVAESMGLQVDDFRDFIDVLRNECYLLKKGPKEYKVQMS